MCERLSEQQLYNVLTDKHPIDSCTQQQIEDTKKKLTYIGTCPPLNPFQMMNLSKSHDVCDPFAVRQSIDSRTLPSRCHGDLLRAWNANCTPPK